MERLKSQVELSFEKEKKTGNKINKLMKEQVTNMMLKDKRDKFTYLTELTTNEFYCLYECVEQFLHLITYPDCKDGGLETKSRKLDTKTGLWNIIY